MKLGSAAVLSLLALSPAAAQSPFDMSPERPADAAPASPAPAQPRPPAKVDEPAKVQTVAPARRYFLPFEDFALSGEDDMRSWSIYVTPEQAAAPARLDLGYQNSLVVAPEASRLRLSINDRPVIDEPIRSSDSVSSISVDIPAGLLRAGYNDMSIGAVQRHRTDCTVASTYELWTEIDPARSFITFQSPGAAMLRRLDDIRAVGVDAAGRTTFNLIVPAIDQALAAGPVLRLSEGLAMMADMPNQAIEISRSTAAKPGPGVLNVAVGTAAEIRSLVGALPAAADSAPLAAVIDGGQLGQSTLIVTGPSWQVINSAIESIVSPFDRSIATQRATLASRSWRMPEPPLLLGQKNVRFSDLGVGTQEFSGRRFRTELAIGIPSDFYANAYGQATLLLDAAYSPQVEPGSHIDIYVNGNIAANVPITASGGEILRHLPIKVTMRHFRPGINIIALEAVLMTAADRTCAPGSSASATSRFVLFDTSEFSMPTFARIGQRPNLAALGGTGFPYSRLDKPLPLIVSRAQPESFSAAATLLARMSVAAGRPIKVDPNATPGTAVGSDALFVGPIADMSAELLASIGVDAESRNNWGEAIATAGIQPRPDTNATFDRWREQLSGSGWRGQVSSFQDWLTRTFNVSDETLRLIPGGEEDYKPGGNTALLVAQQAAVDGAGTWTVVAGPTADMLRDGIRTLASQANWQQLGGHITTYDIAAARVQNLPVASFRLVETQPASLSNYRLIAANWLSANVLSYSMTLTIAAILLGVATYVMLTSLGRKG